MQRKKIAIISTASRGGGSETFLRGLLPPLLKESDNFEYHLFVAKSRKEHYLNISNMIVIHPISDEILDNHLKRLIFENITIISMLKKIDPDLCFYTSEIVSPLVKVLKVPVINMYHAALHFYMIPGVDESRLKLAYIKFMRDLSMRIVNKTVAVSHFEKAELGGRYPKYMFNKFIVIYHGVNLDWFNTQFNEKNVEEFSFQHPYILCVSDRYRHKKIDYMLRVYKILRDNFNVKENLVIVGRSKSSAVDKELFDFVKANNLENYIHFVDYVDNKEIHKYYRNAKLYWTNSSCESFGLTPLEAMACGTPVVSTWESSLPEIYGKSVLYYNPYLQDIVEVAEIISLIIKDGKIHEKYRNIGLEHVENFRWENVAKNYNKLFNRELS